MAKRTKHTLLEQLVAAIGGLCASAVALIAGWIAWSVLVIRHRKPLPPALIAPRRQWTKPQTGTVSYYVDQRVAGRPLVLIHSINAGASAYEMRPLFEYYRSYRSVYAPDLPGFGWSERGDRAYTPELYAQAIIDLIDGEIERDGPVDVIAFSLGSEFAARAALQRPDLIRSLTLISPTGLNSEDRQNRVQQFQQTGASDRVLRWLRFPVWSRALYDLIVSRPSLRYFLQQTFVGEVDPGWLDYTYPATHQPGARYAPFYFLSGKLFTPDIRQTVYERLQIPVLVLYDQNVNVTFDALPELAARNPRWQAQRIVPTLGTPHWEKLRETTEALDRFWQRADDVARAQTLAR